MISAFKCILAGNKTLAACGYLWVICGHLLGFGVIGELGGTKDGISWEEEGGWSVGLGLAVASWGGGRRERLFKTVCKFFLLLGVVVG